jgi:hypothetical protein
MTEANADLCFPKNDPMKDSAAFVRTLDPPRHLQMTGNRDPYYKD